MNNKKYTVWLPLLIGVSMAVGMYLGYYMRDAMPGKKFFSTNKQKPIQEILTLIENKYVDQVDMAAITDTAIEAILSKLDPHSNFIPADKLQGVNEDLQGRLYGIGVEFDVFKDTINVISVLKDGPADKAGIFPGDRILKVGDSVVAGVKISYEKIRGLLRGDKGTRILLSVKRGAEQKKIDISRGTVPLVSVDAAYMAGNGIGIIKLNRFSTQTFREFMEALERLKKEGLQKLILDLRGNGGGVLDDAVQIADEFLSGSKLITYTEGVHFKKKEYRCKRPGMFEDGKLVVLTDERTASASEVLCGALQDWDRATILGRRSFGKGLVQDQYNLSDGSALRLTIARYFTPTGRSIQRPYGNGEKAYYAELNNRMKNGKDSIVVDSTKFFTTSNGRKVFGGGGIVPDILVAADSGNNISERILDRNLISKFALDYYAVNRTQLINYKTVADFNKGFTVTPEMWKGFLALAARDTIAESEIKNPMTVQSQIKATIARVLWRGPGFYEVYNQSDPLIIQAMELLK